MMVLDKIIKRSPKLLQFIVSCLDMTVKAKSINLMFSQEEKSKVKGPSTSVR